MKTKPFKKPRPITAFAVVNKYRPKLDVLDVFKDKEIGREKTERVIRVKIIAI